MWVATKTGLMLWIGMWHCKLEQPVAQLTYFLGTIWMRAEIYFNQYVEAKSC